MSTFAGHWLTTFGPMVLRQEGQRVQGFYELAAGRSEIAGEVKNGKLHFRFKEPGATGEGWFEMPRFGRFVGQWRPDGGDRWSPWVGYREWDGVWDTSFGRMRLIQEENRIFGFYEGMGHSTVAGRREGGHFVFTYQEPKAQGEGWFELSPDFRAFQGQWRVTGQPDWFPWFGRRLTAIPGQIWLAVIEAHWQRNLADVEYSFGAMLREFFARLPHVHVRHRFFDNEEGLQRWCRELIYFPEPVVAVVASHGSPQGLTVFGHLIDSRVLIDSLRHADNVVVLHFSSCLVMQGGAAGEFASSLQQQVPFPISGYNVSVDWAASALIEFNYLDMILSRGLSPQEAAAQITRLIAYAGDSVPEDSPYPAAGFRLFLPARPGPAPAPNPPTEPPAA